MNVVPHEDLSFDKSSSHSLIAPFSDGTSVPDIPDIPDIPEK
jgi:hypothetical protein